MVDVKHQKAKAKNTVAVRLTSDLWPWTNTEAYLPVTRLFIDENDKLGTIWLGAERFPDSHTAENMAWVTTNPMGKRWVKEKVKCLVKDAATNMITRFLSEMCIP